MDKVAIKIKQLGASKDSQYMITFKKNDAKEFTVLCSEITITEENIYIPQFGKELHYT